MVSGMNSGMNSRIALVYLLPLLAVVLALYHLESARSGVNISTQYVEQTPVTRYAKPNTDAPIVIVAHGFAGSRQIMQAYSLTLAQAGYEVLAFDFEGHGRHPVPMSGDVTSIDGTTRLLVLQTRALIAAARDMDNAANGIALLGHSMATDVLLRAAIDEAETGNAISTFVGISMFSEAITATVPPSLLIVNGQWETRLRKPALAQLQLIDPQAVEGQTVRADGVIRRVAVAPYMEHVGVLYSVAALDESLSWLDNTFDRTSDVQPVRIGGWILVLLLGIVLLFKPLLNCLPRVHHAHQSAPELPTRSFWIAILVPAALTPLLALLPEIDFLPVLVADYLLLHLGVYGALQLLLLRSTIAELMGAFTRPVFGLTLLGAFVLCFWGIVVFGAALDRYAASFLPTSGRLTIVIALSTSAIVFMLADGIVSGSGQGSIVRRVVARIALMASLAAAALIDPEKLIFIILILPVLLLFYFVYGLMGRWVSRRLGVVASSLGLGLCLAWALGVSFPLFV